MMISDHSRSLNWKACGEALLQQREDIPAVDDAQHAFNKASSIYTLFSRSGKGNWGNETSTLEALASYQAACESEGQRFSAFAELLVECPNGGGGAHSINFGNCLPPLNSGGCDPYDAASLQLATYQDKSSPDCALTVQTPISDVELRATPVAPTDAKAPTLQPTASPRPSYDDTNRLACQQARNDFFNAHPDLTFDAFLNQGDDLMIREAGTGVLHLETTYPGGNLLAQVQQSCEGSEGRFSSYTGTLECHGTGTKVGTHEIRHYENQAECFPATSEDCKDYSALTFQLDMQGLFHMSCAEVDSNSEEVLAFSAPTDSPAQISAETETDAPSASTLDGTETIAPTPDDSFLEPTGSPDDVDVFPTAVPAANPGADSKQNWGSGLLSSLVGFLILAGALAVGILIWKRSRKNEQSRLMQSAVEYELSDLTLMDDDDGTMGGGHSNSRNNNGYVDANAVMGEDSSLPAIS